MGADNSYHTELDGRALRPVEDHVHHSGARVGNLFSYSLSTPGKDPDLKSRPCLQLQRICKDVGEGEWSRVGCQSAGVAVCRVEYGNGLAGAKE